MKNNKLNIIVFYKLLKVLLIAHAIILIKWKYYYYDSKALFKHALIDALNIESEIIHHTIFVLFILAVLLFCFDIKKIISLSIIGFSFLYFIFSDLFLFHHDIFLATNIAILSALFLKYKNTNTQDIVILAFKCLFTLVMFFSFLYKLNDDFHNGLLINKMISNNSLFAHFVDLKNNKLINQFSPFLAKTTVILEGSIPILLWTKFRYFGAALGCLLHFGICFASGAGIMFNLYLPLLYLFFIPIKRVELQSNIFNRLLKLLDFYGGISLIKNQDGERRSQRFKSYLKFLPSNVFFLLLVSLYFLNVSRSIYNIFFVK